MTSVTNYSPKGFWSLSNWRLDSVAAKAGVIAAGVWFLIYGIPVVKEIMWNIASIIGATLAILAGIAAIALIGFILVDGRIPRLAEYVYRLGVRALVGFFVTLDPIGIMKNYLQDVNKTIAQFSNRISDLRGAIDQAKDDLEGFHDEYKKAMAYVAAARKNGREDDPSVRTQANIANRRKDSMDDLGKLVVQMEAILRLLERYFDKSKAYRDDLKDTIDFEARRRKSLKAAAGAFQAAKRILAGDTIGADFYDEAMAAAQQQAAQMVGEMKQWVFESGDILKTFEMQEAASVEMALQRLEQQEKTGGSLLLDYSPGVPIPQAGEQVKTAVRSTAGQDIERFLR